MRYVRPHCLLLCSPCIFTHSTQLLDNGSFDQDFKITVHSDGPTSSPSLCIEPAVKTRKITCINEWLTAFNIFVGIYTAKFPSEAPALMKYCAIIRDLANKGFAWFYYDENFRFLRQSQASALPWSDIHWELWLTAQQVSVPRVNLSSAQAANLRVPKGFCFQFHKGNVCSGCSFKHACFKCGNAHPAISCNFRGPRRQPTSSSTKKPQSGTPGPAHSS